MAVTKLIDALLPKQGVRRNATRSGVTHVREYQPDRYTIVGNHLAQHRGLSATAVGIAVHILSLPEGARVDIRSLAEWFPEGRARIACALRELEARGYVERVRERLPSGQMVTRTYAFHAPALTRARREGDPETAAAPAAPTPQAFPATTAARPSETPVQDLTAPGGPPSEAENEALPEPVVAAHAARVAGCATDAERTTEAEPSEPIADRAESGPPRGEHRDKAEALLAGLRRTDIRLTLSGREVRRLAPLVVAWFENGLGRASVIHALTDGLPLRVRHPAGFLRNRLLDLLPPALPSLPGAGEAEPLPSRPLPPPPAMTTCEGGCDRGFRAPFRGAWCRDCRAARPGEAPVAPVDVTALVRVF
ncbi:MULTISPECIES: helix-turn-helix domain-containing protein [unclassified Streptomyces]|uniref:helix-turn-helix domain-containing protein n=1 Tax=unclassified Streptomyces TaxID=2593676 RepID=UPI0022574512|nr:MULTISPECIES: helix-turn-helix domain-containing protein [unclassified Streptomyces]MCX4989320.1 helix-turn-helix domain-containing protein [Streptomyces sp. NBC_00568]MCX5005458.1 helix-turn-helix domain-containing protein [Streptomyces sp. NBC_00638]